MSAVRFEYRLRWQRVGLAPVTRIRQRERDAINKAERLLQLDEDKGDPDLGTMAFTDMPDLTLIQLERRQVGEWEHVRDFDVPEPDPASAPVPDERPPAPLDDGDIPW
jgi:hypothetical protein